MTREASGSLEDQHPMYDVLEPWGQHGVWKDLDYRWTVLAEIHSVCLLLPDLERSLVDVTALALGMDPDGMDPEAVDAVLLYIDAIPDGWTRFRQRLHLPLGSSRPATPYLEKLASRLRAWRANR